MACGFDAYGTLTGTSLVPGRSQKAERKMKLLFLWLLHTWLGLAGLLCGTLGSCQADRVAAGFGLNSLRCTVG